MYSTGIVRRVDELGRIVLPKELRDRFEIGEKDPIEIYIEGDKIILRKYNPGCIICGDVNENIVVDGRRICRRCIRKISAAAGRVAHGK